MELKEFLGKNIDNIREKAFKECARQEKELQAKKIYNSDFKETEKGIQQYGLASCRVGVTITIQILLAEAKKKW